MRIMKLRLVVGAATVLLFLHAGCAGKASRGSGMRSEIAAYIDSCDARIGVALISESRDTIEVNGHELFPMQSVYKFPQALALADFCDAHGISLSDSVDVSALEMHADTYSPMRDTYGQADVRVPLDTLLAYLLQFSDNNACDVIFRIMGGAETVSRYLEASGFSGIHVLNTEAEMHADTSLCRANCASPVAMACLLDRFDTELRHVSPAHARIAGMMETCATGKDRIAAPLAASGATVGHKTGTGGFDARGRITSVNDAAYVRMPDGRRYVLVVFVAESGESPQRTSAIIADISDIVRRHLDRAAPAGM